ncbi:hypothetical protein JHFBIEKO_4053 [Methylobacterium mesophilicum]|nr:hypothetical protein JHFBIEKO_4053 [Methylobacterium mesophilicum]
MKGLLLNALLGVGLGRFGSVWGLPVFLRWWRLNSPMGYTFTT